MPLSIQCETSLLLGSNAYLIADKKQGRYILVDCFNELPLTNNLRHYNVGQGPDILFLTHEHYDHIHGVEYIREHYPVCKVWASQACGVNMQNPGRNFSRHYDAYLEMHGTNMEGRAPTKEIAPCADNTFAGSMRLDWCGHEILLKETPGHSPGSICILIDGKHLFAGDTLLKTGTPETGLPGGSKREMQKITLPFLQSLPKTVMVYPGHGEPFELGSHPILAE